MNQSTLDVILKLKHSNEFLILYITPRRLRLLRVIGMRLILLFLPFSLAFIKRAPVIDADKPVSSQLRVLTLSEDTPYETLHSFISNAVAPFFKSYIRESGKADR